MAEERSYISIQSDQGVVYEGEGSIFVNDWRLKVNDGILDRQWYNLLEIRQENDGRLKISQCTAYKKDFYKLGNRPIFRGACNLSFLEKIFKGIGGKS